MSQKHDRTETESAHHPATLRKGAGKPPTVARAILIILGFVLVGLAGAAIWNAVRAGEVPAAAVKRIPFTASRTPTAQPAQPPLEPAAPGLPVPLNTTDVTTGKPIESTSPTVTHKGYTIAFCCDKSSGFRRWPQMSEAERDALVRKYLE